MEFINHVYMNVPYCKNLFDSLKIKPDDFRNHEDLNKLPFLTKDLIRENLEMLKSEKANSLIKSNTGGSTGSPLIFHLGKRRISADIAAKMRATRWWGVDIGDPEIVIWGSPVELSRQDILRNLRDKLFKTKLLSAFDMSEEKIYEYVSIIRKYKPKHIFGYPSSIYLLAKFARQNNIKLHDIGVKVIFCTAERLYDHQRELILDVFDAPVANGYGGRDAGFVAHECPHGSMHITAESIIVEIVDHEGNPLPAGYSGEIVITHLDSHDFPFIRYKTGDVGALSEDTCLCGRGLPILKNIEGRTTDFIITPDGKIMHGLSLVYVLRELEGIKEFKIIQEKPDCFIINIVKDSVFKTENETLIRDGFKKRIGTNIKIVFNYLPKIKAESSGKFRYVVSNIQHPYN
ncbi:MAG: AMP-binding protein [Thermodesulfovibrionia bacterium]|nr:AMP-binding protein [Thermodesulfovibrionia bacterium]